MQKDSEHNLVKVANVLVSAIYLSSKRHNCINIIKTFLFKTALLFMDRHTTYITYKISETLEE